MDEIKERINEELTDLNERIDGMHLVKFDSNENKLDAENCGPKLIISEDGLVVKHSGPNERNCASAISPVPTFNLSAKIPSIPFYFEMEILNNSSIWDGGIGIGFFGQSFPLVYEWLGDVPNSIGISRKDEIWIEGTCTKLENDNEWFKKGDVVGIGIILSSENLKCFATLNGEFLGKADLPVKFSTFQLFPAINLYNAGDSVRANFGNKEDEWQFKEFGKFFQQCDVGMENGEE